MKATEPNVALRPEPTPSAEIPGVARVTSLADLKPSAPVAAPAAPATPASRWSTMLGDCVGGLLNRVSDLLSPSFVEGSLAFARRVGHQAVLVGAGLTLIYGVYAGIRHGSFSIVLGALGMIVALAVAQYAARRFIEASDVAIANTPNAVCPTGFLECAGLLALVLGLVALVGGIVTAIRVSSLLPLWPAILMTIGMAYLGAVALHPTLANVTSAKGSAGEEALGLLSFFAKAGLKLVPLFFGLLAIGGCVAVIASFFDAGQAYADSIASVLRVAPFVPVNAPYGLSGSAVVLFACLLPLFAYFGFLIQYLFLDVLRAILAVPGKLEMLRK